ncbi:MAG: hypothetical protein AAB019_09815 [Planctomycetota bacterium]
MKTKLGQGFLVASLVSVLWLSFIGESQALPTFARKHKTSCTTCHTATPCLNAFGEAYRINGYKMPDLATKEEPVVLMQEAYAKADLEKRSALFPSTLPATPPISVRLLLDYVVDQGGEQAVASDFNYLHETEVMVAGSLGDKFAFFGEIEFEREAGAMETATEGWFQVEDLFLKENLMNVKIGNLEVAMPYASSHHRLTKTHYLYGDWRMPKVGGKRNDWRMRKVQPGLEINGFQEYWHYAVGFVNGNASNEDSNTFKDQYILFRYKLGGMKYTESGTAGEVKPEEGYQICRDKSVQLGAFYYRGKAEVNNREDGFYRLGFDVHATQGKVIGSAGYIKGSHHNPWGRTGNEAIDSTDTFVELEYAFYPWLIGQLRYESLDWKELSDADMLAMGITDQDKTRLITGASALLANNVRLLVELSRAITDDTLTEVTPEKDKNENDRLFVRLDFSF